MATSQIFLLFLLLCMSSLHGIATSIENCPIQYCSLGGDGNGGGGSSVPVKFPFQIINNLESLNPRCRYPRFELLCSRNKTILMLPRSGLFAVRNIDYNLQTLDINDPLNCLPKRFLDNFSLEDSPFEQKIYGNFTFLNCSSPSSSNHVPEHHRTVACLSSENYTVLAVPSRSYNETKLPMLPVPSSCEVMRADVMVPVSGGYWNGLEDDIRLSWSDPHCAPCEYRDEVCGFTNDDTSLVVGCSNSGKESVKYDAIIIGIGFGTSGALFIVALGCYLCGKVWTHDPQRHRRRQPTTELSTSTVVASLDKPTIESYPKTIVGVSGRQPKPNDSTCPICLSRYKPKQTLRTIPMCNHYFHAYCIDKWLRMNASCPVCRNRLRCLCVITSSSTSPISASSRSSSSVLHT